MATPNPALASIPRIAAACQILNLPWIRSALPLGKSFKSNLYNTNDPFEEGPFTAPTKATRKIYTHTGCTASYKSSTSTASGMCSEHLTASLGVSVGCPFLSASVTGQYEKAVLENTNANKTSITATVRVGTILFASPPSLTSSAIRILKYDGGLSAFHAVYGDYYVAGYVLGADAGVMASMSWYSQETQVQQSITITAKVLWWTITHTDDTIDVSSTSTREVSMAGFDTLQGAFIQDKDVKTLVTRIGDLGGGIEEGVRRVGLKDGEEVTEEVCERLCLEGLVVELILMPVKTLREVQMWITNDDLI